jgi:hypothetical protein
MRDRMERMQEEIQHLLRFFREEVARRAAAIEGAEGGLVPIRRREWPELGDDESTGDREGEGGEEE